MDETLDFIVRCCHLAANPPTLWALQPVLDPTRCSTKNEGDTHIHTVLFGPFQLFIVSRSLGPSNITYSPKPRAWCHL